MKGLSKLTAKDAGLTKSVLSEMIRGTDDDDVPVMNIVGTVLSASEHESTLGPFIKFHGNFSAKTVVDPDTEIRSNLLILPGVAESVLLSLCGGLKAGYSTPIGFGIALTISHNTDPRSMDSNPYTWGVNTFGEAPKDDFIDAMWAEIEAAPKKIATPKETPKKGKK